MIGADIGFKKGQNINEIYNLKSICFIKVYEIFQEMRLQSIRNMPARQYQH